MRDAEKEKYWLTTVQQWQASGLSQLEFCRREGIVDSKFYYWRKELKKRKLLTEGEKGTAAPVLKKGNAPEAKFIPIAIKEERQGIARAFGERLEIVTPGGHIIRIA